MRSSPGETARLLMADYARLAGKRLPVAAALMIAGAAAEGLGILMLAPLIAAATDIAQIPGVMRDVAGLARGLSETGRIAVALAVFVLAMILRSALLYWRDGLLARLTAEHEASMKLRAASRLASRGWSFASSIGQAGMQSLLLTDIPRAAQAVGQAQAAAVAMAMLLVQFLLALVLSARMASLALLIVAVGFVLSWSWARRGHTSGISLSEGYERSSATAGRLHAGLKAALAQGTVASFLREYAHSLERLTLEVVRFSRDLASARALTGVGSALAAGLLLFMGDRVFGVPFPVLVTILVLFARMSGPAQQLQQSLQAFAVHAPAYDVIRQRLGGLEAVEPKPLAASEPLPWRELRIAGATFEHRPGLGVHRANLSLSGGEWLGLAGPSGVGKTTLVDIAAGLVRPQCGRVTVDGQPVEGSMLDRWRAGLAYVAQNDAVFDDSVADNLLAGGAEASEEQMWEVLDLVGLADRVRALPDGLHSSVGERGSQMSGGERQRLVIARAMLRRPSLIILDEATSALDPGAELLLLERLRAVTPRPAAILIAHRESTLQICDRIVELAPGSQRT